jgi:hemoglobin/transferrin/lactoferrin receptor protein
VVLDASTGDPVGFATVSSDDPPAYALTDAAGRVDFSAFAESPAIVIRSVGYRSDTLSFATLRNRDFRILLEPDRLTLDQVVVSASRWAEDRQDLPVKITTISSRDVALQNPQTAADLLGASGEVFIQKSQQGGGSPMIRGFSTNRLLYTVDGVRMNTAIFRGGNLHNVISLDPFAISSAEVLFGPGSIIYGSDAIGGVMSFQTLTPDFSATGKTETAGRVNGRYASANNEVTGHADWSIAGERWAALTSVTRHQLGDLRMGQYGPEAYLRPVYVERRNGRDTVLDNPDPRVQIPSGYTQLNLMQKLRFRPDDRWTFDYGFHYSRTSDFARFDRLTRFRNGLPRSAEWYYGPQTWLMNHLLVTDREGTDWYDRLRVSLAQQQFGESRNDRNFGSTLLRRREERVQAWSLNLDLQKRLGRAGLLYYGVEAVRNDVRSTGTDERIDTGQTSPGPTRYPQADWSSYAAYVNYQYDLSPAWRLQAGTRYNQFVLNADFSANQDFFPIPAQQASLNSGALTGSLGLVYRPNEVWSWTTNLSTGFRAPNVDDIGKVFDSEPGAVVVPNPDLEAEYAYNVEMGLARRLGRAVTLDLTAFYTWLDNALVRRNFTLGGRDSILYDGELSQVQAIQNAAVARVYGIQAGLLADLPGGFGLQLNYTFQRGEEELDDGTVSPSRHAAPAFGVARLRYRANRLETELAWVVSDGYRYEALPISEQNKPELYAVDEQGRPYSPSWNRLDWKALYRFGACWSLSTGVENITDQRYRTYSSGVAAAGRNLFFALQFSW